MRHVVQGRTPAPDHSGELLVDGRLNRPISAHSVGLLLEVGVSRGELSHGTPEEISKELISFSPTLRTLDRPGS